MVAVTAPETSGAAPAPATPEPQAPWRRAMLHVRGVVSGPPLEPGLDVTIPLHPDRTTDGTLPLGHLVSGGVRPSRLAAGTGSGGLHAPPDDDRWRWEHAAFAGAYDDAPPAQRPTYGALNHARHPAGGAVHLGSSHLRLAPHVLARTTFCCPGGGVEPTTFGTAEHMPLITIAAAAGTAVDPLDAVIEAHVHGALRLNRDIAALVLDPSFRGTEVEVTASALPFPVEWHQGFTLSVDALVEHHLGADVVAAARAIARHGVLDARVIGEAALAGLHDPQLIDQVWRCTARFGRPAQP